MMRDGNRQSVYRNQIAMAHVPKLAPLEPSPKRSAKAAEAGKSGATAAAQAKGTYDRDLVRRAQANDKEAYEELVKRHQQRVFAVAAGILRRHEDIVKGKRR